eukprot:scaffold376_cov454-Pavlova_lutheri.AAC.4
MACFMPSRVRFKPWTSSSNRSSVTDMRCMFRNTGNSNGEFIDKCMVYIGTKSDNFDLIEDLAGEDVKMTQWEEVYLCYSSVMLILMFRGSRSTVAEIAWKGSSQKIQANLAMVWPMSVITERLCSVQISLYRTR